MIRKFRSACATYTVSETTDDTGRITIEFRTTNPPRGLDEVLYSWTGLPGALSVPPLTGSWSSEASDG